jgi:hypothetical protein
MEGGVDGAKEQKRSIEKNRCWLRKKKLVLRQGGVCVSGLIAIKKLVRASASFAPLLLCSLFILSYLILVVLLSLEIMMVIKIGD